MLEILELGKIKEEAFGYRIELLWKIGVMSIAHAIEILT